MLGSSLLVMLLAREAFALAFPPRYKSCRDDSAYFEEFCLNRGTETLNKTAIYHDSCCSLLDPYYGGDITARGESIANASLTTPNNTIPAVNHTMWHTADEPVPENYHMFDQQKITIWTYSKFNNSCSNHSAQSKHKLKPFKCKNFGEHDRFSEVQFKLPQTVHDLGINCTIDFFNGTGCHSDKLTGRK